MPGELPRFLVEPLAQRHKVDAFDCGNSVLNDYLRRYASQNVRSRYGRTYVYCTDIDEAGVAVSVAGYYTLSMSAIALANCPPDLVRRMPRYPVPAVHLGCLAVDKASQGKGIGRYLLLDAMSRALAAAEVVAARVLEVKAIDESARSFYLKYDFKSFIDNPAHLFIPLDTIRPLGLISATGD